MAVPYFHVHSVIFDKCLGHMACMRPCPTQAIRVRNSKAVISEELCVDCGTCISVCPEEAIAPTNTPHFDLSHYKYKVVVPSPVIYSQFDSNIHPYVIHLAFMELGFDEVVDIGVSSSMLGRALVKYISRYKGRLPLISSHCPSALRLIQVKYPDLLDLVVPFDVPREITAREIRKTIPLKLGIKSEDIGIIYIAPCPAKIVSILQPAEKTQSWFDGFISVKEIYSKLYEHVAEIQKDFDENQVPESFIFSSGWATFGSLTQSVKMKKWLAVSGLSHVMKIFDDIENSRLRNIDFVEALTCMLGCIGGPFSVENPYIARTNSIEQQERYEKPIEIDDEEIEQKLEAGYFSLENKLVPRPTKYFDTDIKTSIKKMKEVERIYKKLRQIDCGCCGSPTCLAFAEDYVRGEVGLTDCIFLANQGLKSK